jgi:hypothetical protein
MLPKTVKAHKSNQGKSTPRDYDRFEAILRRLHPTGTFREGQVNNVIQQEMEMSHSSVGNYLRGLAELGRLRKTDEGYTFGEEQVSVKPDYRLFLHCKKPEILTDVLRVIRSLSDKLALAVQEDALYSVLNDGHGHMALHVKLSSSFFEEYHVARPVQFQVESEIALRRVQRLKDIQIALKEGSDSLSIDQFDIKLEDLKALETPLGDNQNEDFKSELTIKRQELEQILSDNRVNSDYMDLVATANGLTLQSVNEKGDYRKVISDGYTCKEPSISRLYYLDHLIRCLKASKCETVRLRNNGIFVVTEFDLEPSVKLSLFLTTKTLQEEKSPVAV